MRLIIFAIIVNFSQSLFAQGKSGHVDFNTEFPNRGQTVTFCYAPNTSIFHNGSDIQCKIFLSGVNIDTDIKEFPKVVQPTLVNSNGTVCGSFIIPGNAMGIVVHFFDSLQLSIDNNNGQGYWIPVYNGDKILPGSLSSIASILGHTRIDLRCSKSSARDLFERDFRLHPEVKRQFNRNYLNSFDIYNESGKDQFLTELQNFKGHDDLNESELLEIQRLYSILLQPDSAKRYGKLAHERFPNGSSAVQWNSLFPMIAVDTMTEINEKWRNYQKYKNKYYTNYPDAFTRMVMQNRLGQLLQGMVIPMIEVNKLATWESEVGTLDARAKYNTYFKASYFILDQLQSKFIGAVNKPNTVSIRTESQLFQFQSLEEQQLIQYSEKLARESTLWFRTFLDSPRTYQDEPIYTDLEIRAQREYLLALVMDVLGRNLLAQNKPEEAREVLGEAVSLAKGREASMNEHYIESLVKVGKVSEAMVEANKAISIGKSTSSINNFHKSYAQDTSSKQQAMTALRTRLKSQMRDDEIPEVALLNTKGETVMLKDMKGKTIVIDFWATWCKPCIIGMESSIEVIEHYKREQDVVFLFVNAERITEENRVKVNKRIQEMGYDFQVFFDPDFKATQAFKVEALPTTVIIDSKGKVKFRSTGVNLNKGNLELSDELITMIELARW